MPPYSPFLESLTVIMTCATSELSGDVHLREPIAMPDSTEAAASRSHGADDHVVSVGAPVPFRPGEIDLSPDDGVGGLDAFHSIWGGGRRMFYVRVPTDHPCQAPWHSEPDLPEGSSLRPFDPQAEVTDDDLFSADHEPWARLSELARCFDHTTASQNASQLVVQLRASDESADGRPLLGIFASCSHTVMELLQALRAERAKQQGEFQELMPELVVDSDDLEGTPLSIFQISELYPDFTAHLREVDCAVFGKIVTDDASGAQSFVAIAQTQPYEVPAEFPAGFRFLGAYDTWLSQAVTDYKASEGAASTSV